MSEEGSITPPNPTKASYNPINFNLDLEDQSEVLIGTEVIRVSKLSPECAKGNFVKYFFEDSKTLYEVFRRGVRESNNGPCLGWRSSQNQPFQWLHYNEALLRAQNFGAGLVSLGHRPGPKTFVGIFCHNCPEWILTEQALYCQSMVIVPLYDTLGPNALSYILNQTNMSTVVCQDEGKMLQILSHGSKSLRLFITLKDASQGAKNQAKNAGAEVRSFEQVEELGCSSGVKEVAPKPGDICTISYTSGTAGHPKGVLLTHENIVAGVSASLMQLGDYRPNSTDVMLSFLPLAHMLERCCEIAMYMVGGAVGFFSGDIKTLTSDYRSLRPTISPSVPRLMNKVYEKFMTEINSSFLKGFLFRMALSSKNAQIEKYIVKKNSIWDKLVFKKVQDSMGGKLRLMIVGSAPLAGNVLTFMRCALGCIIVEGYGQTECSAPATLTIAGDIQTGQVGPPLSCNAVKLKDVPDMNYYASRSQGEICIRGPNVFQGYYRNPEKSKESVDSQGWLNTGDIGQWLPNGTLKIIDRRKHMYKLSQGEYIVPEKIEKIYIQCPFISQIFVHGEGLQSSIVGIVVPKVETIKQWAKENGISGTLSVLCADENVKELILSDIRARGTKAGLKSFEQVKDIYLHPDPFSVQNGLLTPDLKLKRPKLRQYFKPQVDDLYASLR